MENAVPRRRSWLLIVSLCLNVLLIAAIATVAVRIAHRDLRIVGARPLGARAVLAQFPDERPRIAPVVAAHRAKVEALRRASIAARESALEVLGKRTATPQDLSAAFAAVGQADAALEAEVIAMDGEGVLALTAGERVALAEKLRARERSWWYRTFVKRGE
jgi:uncharacterized membrane protein